MRHEWRRPLIDASAVLLWIGMFVDSLETNKGPGAEWTTMSLLLYFVLPVALAIEAGYQVSHPLSSAPLISGALAMVCLIPIVIVGVIIATS